MLNFDIKKRQILERVDLYALVSEHVTLRRSGRRWVGLCPFHSEKTPSFTVSPEIGVFKCFGCGRGGDVFSFVQYRENVSFMDAMQMLADRAGVTLETRQQAETGPASEVDSVSRGEVAAACAWAKGYFQSLLRHESKGRVAREYLTGRGFSEATLERFGVGLALDGGSALRSAAAEDGLAAPVLEAADLIRQSEDGRWYDTFRDRVMFPIHDATGRVVGFGGRTLVEDRAKYLNTRQTVLFDKGRGLYGVELARSSISERGRAIVVEGYTDCMACHQAGFTETVATLGTALTESQVDLLRRYCDELILVFDSDSAGVEAADRAMRVALPRGVKVRLARVPEGKDPGEFLIGPWASERFADVLKSASDALELAWRRTVAEFEADTSDVRRREAILSFIRVVGEASGAERLDAIQKGLLVNQVAHLLRMDRDEVGRMFVSVRAPRGGPVPPVGAMESRRTQPPDAGQSAWTTALEILLNEPALIGEVADLFEPDSIRDERDRRIATWMFEAAREYGEFRLSDILARSSTAEDSERIVDLAHRGERRGRFAESLRSATERIRRAAREAELEQSRRRVLEAAAEGKIEAASEELTAYQEEIRRHRRFGPRRVIRRVSASSGSEPSGGVEQSDAATTTEFP